MKKTNRIRNPLIRRVPREFVCDWRKYAVIFLFLVLMIGAISGLCVSNDSMLQSLNENVTRLKLEDGHFELAAKECGMDAAFEIRDPSLPTPEDFSYIASYILK